MQYSELEAFYYDRLILPSVFRSAGSLILALVRTPRVYLQSTLTCDGEYANLLIGLHALSPLWQNNLLFTDCFYATCVRRRCETGVQSPAVIGLERLWRVNCCHRLQQSLLLLLLLRVSLRSQVPASIGARSAVSVRISRRVYHDKTDIALRCR